jgi:hypothetical protein
MENGLVKTLDETRVARVLASLRSTSEGHEFSKDWPDKGMQEANSYIEGLSATPWHDTAAPAFEWARTLEENWEMIAQELSVALQQKPQVQPEAATSEWVAAVREEALAYGPEWRTMVLQDRGRWDDDRMRLFPKTVKLLKVSLPYLPPAARRVPCHAVRVRQRWSSRGGRSLRLWRELLQAAAALALIGACLHALGRVSHNLPLARAAAARAFVAPATRRVANV